MVETVFQEGRACLDNFKSASNGVLLVCVLFLRRIAGSAWSRRCAARASAASHGRHRDAAGGSGDHGIPPEGIAQREDKYPS